MEHPHTCNTGLSVPAARPHGPSRTGCTKANGWPEVPYARGSTLTVAMSPHPARGKAGSTICSTRSGLIRRPAARRRGRASGIDALAPRDVESSHGSCCHQERSGTGRLQREQAGSQAPARCTVLGMASMLSMSTSIACETRRPAMNGGQRHNRRKTAACTAASGCHRRRCAPKPIKPTPPGLPCSAPATVGRKPSAQVKRWRLRRPFMPLQQNLAFLAHSATNSER